MGEFPPKLHSIYYAYGNCEFHLLRLERRYDRVLVGLVPFYGNLLGFPYLSTLCGFDLQYLPRFDEKRELVQKRRFFHFLQ